MDPPFESIYGFNETVMLRDAYKAISRCELWDWIRTYEPQEGKGFIFSRDPNLDRISNELRYEGHSGGSWAWTMRVMESIAKNGWEEHAAARQRLSAAHRPKGNPCPCRKARGLEDGWCGVAGGGVPGCEH